MRMDKVYNVYFNIVNAMVVWLVVVLTNGIFRVFLSDVIKVTLESVHESPLGLSHIQYIAGFASDTVNKISAFAINPGFGGITPLGE